jgi:ArsR family transcriptional regulator, arsenate/arsenite/antimonite-responsive transcriptional repressor
MTIEQCFMGLADRTRLRILNLLLRGELCGCDIQYVLEVSQSNVSRHLNYLKRAGLVLDRRDGYRVYYRLAEREEPSFSLLFEFLRGAFGRDKLFSADLRALKGAIRKGACTVSEAPRRALSQNAARKRAANR